VAKRFSVEPNPCPLPETPRVAFFRSRWLIGLTSRPEDPPDPVATGDLPRARGDYSSRVGNAHASGSSHPCGAGWGIVAWIRDSSDLGAPVPAWVSACRLPKGSRPLGVGCGVVAWIWAIEIAACWIVINVIRRPSFGLRKNRVIGRMPAFTFVVFLGACSH
jgi:hypothetical protein